MKILIVIPSVGALRGGPSHDAMSICKWLSRFGDEITIVATDDNGLHRLDVPLKLPISKDGYEIIYFPRQTKIYTISIPLAIWLYRNIGKYDCIHINGVFSYAPTIASFLARKKHVPHVINPRGILQKWGMHNRRYWLKRISIFLNERIMLQKADKVIFNSEKEKEEALQVIHRMKSAIMPHGVDLEEYDLMPQRGWLRSKYLISNDEVIILSLSRISEEKGLEILIEAFKKLEPNKAALLIAGEGKASYEIGLRKLASESSKRIIWLGYLDQREKLLALADCDIFVLPSRADSFGIVTIEAMACGKPVIISDQVGIFKEIKDAGVGLVAPCDAGDFYLALEELTRDEQLRSEMGNAGRELAYKQYDNRIISRRIREIYEEITD